MGLKRGTRAEVGVFSFDGPLTLTEAGDLRQAFREEVAAGQSRFVFDLRGVNYMDSAAMGELAACLKRARERSGDLKLVVEPDSRVHQLLRLAALDGVFALFDEVDPAVVDFSGA